MFQRIINALISRLFLNHFQPKMILGYYCRKNKTYLKNTRRSNTASIVGANKLTIGDNVFIGHFNTLDASNDLTIGEGVQITNFVSILTHSSHIAIRLYGKHYIEHNGRQLAYVCGRTIIGSYSFIGPHSTIMPGVTLGQGTIISSHSYVKAGSYPDFAILAGCPAVVVGDSRDLDREYLLSNPELSAYYIENNNHVTR